MKKKSNVLVFGLIFLIILAILLDVFLVLSNHGKNKEINEGGNKEVAVCEFECSKNMPDLIDSQSGITYHRKDIYSFMYLYDTHEVSSAKYSGIFSFNTLEEFNKVENIPTLILDTEYDVVADSDHFTKTYNYYILLRYGVNMDTDNYLDEYVDKIENEGFACKKECS